MIEPRQADDATLMRLYKESLTHTLDAALRAVYERGLHDGIDAASAPQSPEPVPVITGPAPAPPKSAK
jgi:hypothetical protein